MPAQRRLPSVLYHNTGILFLDDPLGNNWQTTCPLMLVTAIYYPVEKCLIMHTDLDFMRFPRKLAKIRKHHR